MIHDRYKDSYINYNELFIMALNPYFDKFKDDDFAQEVYASLCNMKWRSIFKPKYEYSCSWRYAGGLVAEIRGKGESFLDYYFSGGEGVVTERVATFFKGLGFLPVLYKTKQERYESE